MNDESTIEPGRSTPDVPGSSLRRFGLPAALLVGGLVLGSTLMPVGLANAQDPASGTEGNDETGCAEPVSGRGLWRGRLLGGIAELEELLGLTAEEIHTALADGQTLAEVADGTGVSTEELVAALVARATERIDLAVADGRIGDARAEELEAGLEAKITERVTTVHDHEHRGRHGRFVHRSRD